MLHTPYAIGVDIGGTHITSSVVDLSQKQLVVDTLHHQMVDASASPEPILDTWAATIRQSMDCVPGGALAGVGIAMPGPFDYENGISRIRGLAKYEQLYGYNVKEALMKRLELPSNKIQFMNDANCFLRAVGNKHLLLGLFSDELT